MAKVEELTAAGELVSFARVAREAHVSTWLVYNADDLRRTIRAAMQDQLVNEHQSLPGSQPRDATAESFRTDLALAREEIRSLREDRDKLRRRFQLQLGAEVVSSSSQELVDRIHELEASNGQLRSALDESERLARRLQAERDDLEADLEGKIEALRKLMFMKNL